MKILILGGDGMLGHRLLQHFRPSAEVRVTLRQDASAYSAYGLFDSSNAYYGIDARAPGRIEEVIEAFEPGVVVNAVGIVKQRDTAKESIPSIEVNALLPHRLALMCSAASARLMHISTDCVFSGSRGNYREDDFADAADLYGRTKFLGEVHEPHCLTLRTSIIGPEISRKASLVEWFLAQRSTVRGFTKAIFSGLTTAELSRVIERMVVHHPDASGLYHVSSEPINKYDLLVAIREALGLDIEIVPDASFEIDRSLDSTRFRSEFNYAPPSWAEMIDELANDMKAVAR
jgi:dTDP-4-dehydrorhamnose reductase